MTLRISKEYKKMCFEDGCPNCGSEDTGRSWATIDLGEDVEVCLCDECGYTLPKYEESE